MDCSVGWEPRGCPHTLTMHTQVPTARGGWSVGGHGAFHVVQEPSAAEQANEIDFTVLSLLQDEDPAAPARPQEPIAIMCTPLLSLSPLLL